MKSADEENEIIRARNEVEHERKRLRKRTTKMVVDGGSIKRILLARKNRVQDDKEKKL
jgi:hypothetical protein